MQYLIGYDISDPKRLQKIHSRIQKMAIPLQYSVFLFDDTKEKLQQCIDTTLSLMNKQEDDFRIYPLPQNSPYWQLARPILPDGILLSLLPRIQDTEI